MTSLQWTPLGADRIGLLDLAVGDQIGLHHQVWTVQAITERPPESVDGQGTHQLTVCPHHGGEPTSFGVTAAAILYRYPSLHIPVCHECGEPSPCRHQLIDEVIAAERARQRRYELAGICPACEQPITTHQIAQTWPHNLIVPAGPPVSFHLRPACMTEANDYDLRCRSPLAAGLESLTE